MTTILPSVAVLEMTYRCNHADFGDVTLTALTRSRRGFLLV